MPIKKEKLKIRNVCQALDQDGRVCRKPAFKSFRYHGDSELYNGEEVKWVNVWFCKKHYKATEI